MSKPRKQSLFSQRRPVFQNPPGESGPWLPKAPTEAAKKPLEATDKNKPAVKSADSYTVADLGKARADASAYLGGKIHHERVLAEARTALAQKLNPLEARLTQLEEEKKNERLGVKADVENAVLDSLKQADTLTFSDLPLGSFNFMIDPPLKMDQFDRMKTLAEQSAKSYERYRTEHEGKGKFAPEIKAVNGTITCVFEPDRSQKEYKDLREKAYIGVTCNGNAVSETHSDPKLDKAKADATLFMEAFNAWQKSPDQSTSFTYGDTVPQQECDLSALLQDLNGDKSAVRLSFIRQKGQLPPDLNDDSLVERWVTTEYEGDKKVKVVVKANRVLDPDSQEVFTQDVLKYPPDSLQETREYVQIIGQRRHNMKTVSLYRPQASPTSPRTLSDQETFQDDESVMQATFDKEGNMTQRTARVPGCDGVEAIDTPTGSGNVELLDDKGNPIPGNNGKPMMEADTTREMVIRNKQGKEVRIKSFEAMKQDAESRGQEFNEEAYFKFLADNLQTKEQMHAFTQLMFKYRADRVDEKGKQIDKWNEPMETAQNTKGGRMVGDCEDYASFMQKILQKQNKRASVVGLPGHAECIVVRKDAKGRFHAESYSNFGVDVDGIEAGSDPGMLGRIKKAGYDSPEAAVRSLESKWQAKNSGNLEMKDGSLTALDPDHKSLTVIQLYDNVDLPSGVQLVQYQQTVKGGKIVLQKQTKFYADPGSLVIDESKPHAV